MATKIRLSRHGKKDYAFYHIVVADSRAPRDGRFIEKIGTYNPNSNPASIEINFQSALDWIEKGAQPTDTARALLSYKGVMMMHHLNGGVKKGALTPEQAIEKFEKWLSEKEDTIQSKRDGLKASATKNAKDRMAAETKVKEDKAKIVAAKLAAAAQSEAQEAQAEQTIEIAEEAIEAAQVAEVATEQAAEVVASKSVEA